jgi:hypothetical protein
MCRAWRYGQQSRVKVTYLLLRGTIDAHIKEAIVKRNKLADEFDHAIRPAGESDHRVHFIPSVWEQYSNRWEDAGNVPSQQFLADLTTHSATLSTADVSTIFQGI